MNQPLVGNEARKISAIRVAAIVGLVAGVVGVAFWVGSLFGGMTDPKPPLNADVSSTRGREEAQHEAAGSDGSAPCAKREVLEADVDGDGVADLVFHDWVKNRPILGVCTGDGRMDQIGGEAQAELLRIIDVEADGRDEILYGGTTTGAEVMRVGVFYRGHLRPVVRAGQDPFLVVQGLDPGILATRQPAGAALGCEDRTEDGVSDLVQVSVRPKGRKFKWTRVSYSLEGSAAMTMKRETGKLRNDPDTRDVDEVVREARQLTSHCEVEAE